MLRLLLAAIGAVVVAPASIGAAAYDTWCADDPIVSVGGRLLDIQVQMPVAYVATMRSTALTVHIPRNVVGFVVVDDVSAFPMQTLVDPDAPPWDGTWSLPITVVVEVSSTVTYEVRVTATQLTLSTTLSSTLSGGTLSVSTSGTSNSRLVLPMQLGP